VTSVRVLTPTGTGAIATVSVQGPQAWLIARELFRPLGKRRLPELPPRHRFWFGTLADGDDVVLAVRETDPGTCVEVHCHGGRRVVRWVVEQFVIRGCTEADEASSDALSLMTRATTTRTAAILLDQHQGAFGKEMRALEADNREAARERLETLASRIPLGRHLVEPWRVVLAGPPNVGKSSLLNALAGFQRSVVAATAGTTRDVVTVPAAFDGWPVELADTAGLRHASDTLEREGIERARQFLANADLIIWLLDASEAEPTLPGEEIPQGNRCLVILNKCDLRDDRRSSAELRVSARTGEGVPELAAAIARRLVPRPPPPGSAVPCIESHFHWIEETRKRLGFQ